MKIADVTVGEQYAAHDSPTGYRSRLPRQVEALEIVTIEERKHRYSSYVADQSNTIKRRKVKVRIVDDRSEGSFSSYRWPILTAVEGAEIVIEAKYLLAPWSHLKDDVKKSIEEKVELEAADKALEERVMRLAKFATKAQKRKEFYLMPDVRRYGGRLQPELLVEGEAVDWLLSLAEKGAFYESGGEGSR